MRLAVFTSKYPARVATFFERDMRSLIDAGVEIDIFPIYPLDDELWQYSLDLLGEDVLPRERIHHLDLSGAVRQLRPWPVRSAARFAGDSARIVGSAVRYGWGPMTKSAYVMPKAWTWARQFANRFDHVLAYWGNYAGSCAYVFHRLTNPQTPFSMWLHAGTDLYFRPVYLREKIAYADRIVTCCAFNQDYLKRRFPAMSDELDQKVHVNYHGLDLSALPFSRTRPPRRIIAVGRFARDKGFGDLLRAVYHLRRQRTEVELHLVGDGPETQNLRTLAKDLGIADSVVFRGWLPFDEVPAAMRESTILVHPSTGLGDGLPNVIREAMAVGTPVIASCIAGIPEALDDGRCGILVPPRNPHSLADAIASLLANPPRQHRLAELARRRTETMFDMWRNGRELAHVLRTTPARPARASRPIFVTRETVARRS